MAVSQNKVVTPQGLASGQAVCVAAKITYNDAVNAVRCFAAGPNGALVFSLKALPRMTVTAVQLQAYRSKDAGVTLSLIKLIVMGAYTMAATTAPGDSDFNFTETAPLRLAANEEIWVATGVAFATGVQFDLAAENL